MLTTVCYSKNTMFNFPKISSFPLVSFLSKSIKEGDLLVSKNPEKDFNIPRFDSDSTYSVRPGVQLTVKESIRGAYYGETFRPGSGTKHFLIEGQDAFIDNFTEQTTNAIYIPADVAKDRLEHKSTAAAA